MADQSRAPYLTALAAYVQRDPARLHVPGHKGTGADPELTSLLGEAAVAHDVPAGIEGIDAGAHPTPFEQAQSLAAAAWGARRSWFLLNGASGGNHAICLALAHAGRHQSGPAGGRGCAVVQRNVHSSTIDGLVLSGLRPRFVTPEIDGALGVAHCVGPESLDAALTAAPQARAAIVVSPTYFGAVARVRELADVAHHHGVPLVVDEAWGAHLYFHPELPAGALREGADVVLSSTHKIVGSLTQSAVLHVAGDLVDADVMDRSVTLIESTSPSSLLTASLDAARRFAATEGREHLDETLATLAEARARIAQLPGLGVVEGLDDHVSVAAWDPLRLTVDVRGTRASGHAIAALMRERDDVNVELSSENVIVAVFGLGERAAVGAERLLGALEHVARSVGPHDAPPPGRLAPPPPWGPLELAPRDAFLADQEVVGFAAAEGRVSAESLAAYPPGVPNVLPGERLTAGTLAYVSESVAHGGLVRGASDRSLATLRVVREWPRG